MSLRLRFVSPYFLSLFFLHSLSFFSISLKGQVNPYAEGIAKSLSREKLDNVSNHLTLFLHHLRDNSTKVKKDLQVSSHSFLSINCDFFFLNSF